MPLDPKLIALVEMYPECSGNRYCCPENDGHGCCGEDLSVEEAITDMRDYAENGIMFSKAKTRFSTIATTMENYKKSIDEYIALNEQQIIDQENMIDKMREGMQELYRLRGGG